MGDRPSFDRTYYDCGEPRNMRRYYPHPHVSAQYPSRAVVPTKIGNNSKGCQQVGEEEIIEAEEAQEIEMQAEVQCSHAEK